MAPMAAPGPPPAMAPMAAPVAAVPATISIECFFDQPAMADTVCVPGLACAIRILTFRILNIGILVPRDLRLNRLWLADVCRGRNAGVITSAPACGSYGVARCFGLAVPVERNRGRGRGPAFEIVNEGYRAHARQQQPSCKRGVFSIIQKHPILPFGGFSVRVDSQRSGCKTALLTGEQFAL